MIPILKERKKNLIQRVLIFKLDEYTRKLTSYAYPRKADRNTVDTVRSLHNQAAILSEPYDEGDSLYLEKLISCN